MPWVERRGQSYYVCFKRNGRVTKKSCGRDRQRAERLCQELEELLWQRRSRTIRRPTVTLADFAAHALDLAETSLTKRGAGYYRDALKALTPTFGQSGLSEITPERFEAYRATRIRQVDERTVGQRSANRDLSFLRWLMRKARTWGYLDDDPLVAVNPVRYEARRARVLSEKEIAALLEQLQHPLREVALTILETGLRHGECRGLRWADVDLEEKRLWIGNAKSGRRTGGGQPQSVPMSDVVANALQGLKRQGDYVFTSPQTGGPYRSFRSSIQRAAKRAGIGHMTVHDLRHTALTRLAAVTDIRTVQAIARHRDLRTTMRYAHEVEERKRQAVNRLPPV